MRTPIRFRRFVVGYTLVATGLLIAPSTTVPGEGLTVGVRTGVAADPMDLAFDETTGRTLATRQPVDVRPSASAVVDTSDRPIPIGISIPSIQIEGAVVAVGIGADRQLDVPFADTAGWYQHSSSPDDPGATVIAAHVDYGGGPGLFFNLRLAEVGDLIEVARSDRSTANYLVTQVTLYDKDELPADELFRTGGAHALHLVTCGGSFDRIARSYRGNQVITAIPLRG
ncbi:MAG: class F sortase [Acidimicrobiia bacterium]